MPGYKLSELPVAADVSVDTTVLTDSDDPTPVSESATLGLILNLVPRVITFPIYLPAITATGDVMTTWTPGFAGLIDSYVFVVEEEASTVADITINFEVGTTNLTGGVLTLDETIAGTLGAVVSPTAITANNSFTDTDTISIEAVVTTAFTEGRGYLLVNILAAA